MSDRAQEDERYARQIRFAPIGETGQRRLRDCCVWIVGVGALGSSLAEQMVRAGVGTVRLADRDFVEPSNLQRQSLFEEADAQMALPKAVAAAARLRRINSAIRVESYVTDVNARTIDSLLAGADLVLDGTDNAAVRIALSDACFRWGIPLLYGGITGSEGSCAALVPGETACLRCLIGGEEIDEPARNCETAGIIYPVVSFIASLQAAEALKWLSGNRKAMRRSWLDANVWQFRVREYEIPGGRESCPFCGNGIGLHSEGRLEWTPRVFTEEEGARSDGREGWQDRQRASGVNASTASVEPVMESVVLCGRDMVQVTMNEPLPLQACEARLRERHCRILTRNAYLIRAETPEGYRLAAFPDGRVLVQGAPASAAAPDLCQKYLSKERRAKV